MRQRNPQPSVIAMRRLPMVVACAVLLGGCAGTHFGTGTPFVPKPADGALLRDADGPPDFVRGVQALADGRTLDAEHDLLRLADLGYPDAGLLLAATYAERDTLDSEAQALDWFRKSLRQRPEADIGMARVLMATGSRSDGVEALRLIRNAKASRGEPQADNLLLAVFTLHPELDSKREAPALAARNARSPLNVDRRQAVTWYRTNIAVGDNVFKLRKLCEDNRKVIPGCYGELTHFHRYGGSAERLDDLVSEAITAFEALEAKPASDLTPAQQAIVLAQSASQMALAMVDQFDVVDVPAVYDNFGDARNEAATVAQDVQNGADATPALTLTANGAPEATAASLTTPTRPDLADRLLRWMLLRPGFHVAFAASIINRHPYLTPDVDLTASLLPVAKAGNHEATLQLGEAYSSSLRGQTDAAAAERYLAESLAFRSTRQRAHYQLARLYERGFLGEPDGGKILEHLLAGVRGGDQRSAARLARVFYGVPGIRVNRVGAYVFARLSEDAGQPVVIAERVLPRNVPASALNAGGAPAAVDGFGYRIAVRMLDRLAVELTDHERAQAEALYKAERALRPTPRAPIPADIYSRKASS